MNKTAVIYWSGTGNTQAMAEAVAQGAEGQLFAVSEISAAEAAAYDALALGCPAMGDEVLEENEFEPFFSSAPTAGGTASGCGTGRNGLSAPGRSSAAAKG